MAEYYENIVQKNNFVFRKNIYVMKYLLTSVVIGLIFMGCGGSGSSYDLKGYHTEGIGGNATYAEYIDTDGSPISKGYVISGVRNGTWTTYHPTTTKVKKVTNYINGKKNGPELVFNERGYLDGVTEYRNDEYHGLVAVYRNGRTISETNYANGVMHGAYKIYDDSRGKIQRSGYFKNGKQHGEQLYFDDQGNITMKYEYKDGEKVSGGIVESSN